MLKNVLKSICFIILVQLFQSNIIMAQNEVSFPKPNGNSNQLFFLQRTPNANTVVYELNVKNGELDSIEPVHIFWILYGKNAEI